MQRTKNMNTNMEQIQSPGAAVGSKKINQQSNQIKPKQDLQVNDSPNSKNTTKPSSNLRPSSSESNHILKKLMLPQKIIPSSVKNVKRPHSVLNGSNNFEQLYPASCQNIRQREKQPLKKTHKETYSQAQSDSFCKELVPSLKRTAEAGVTPIKINFPKDSSLQQIEEKLNRASPLSPKKVKSIEQIHEKIDLVSQRIQKLQSQKQADDENTAFENLILQYNKRIKSYLQVGEFDKAISDSKYILNLQPNNIDALYQRGIAYMEKRDIESAIQDFQRILKIDSNHVSAAFMKASCLNLKGEYYNAIDQYQDAIEKDIEINSIISFSSNLHLLNHQDNSIKKQSTNKNNNDSKPQKQQPVFYFNQLEYEELSIDTRTPSTNVTSQTSPYQFGIKKLSVHSNSNPNDCNLLSSIKKNEKAQGLFRSNSENKSNTKLINEQPKQNSLTQVLSNNKLNDTQQQQSIEYFKQGFLQRQKQDYFKAIEFYSLAITLNPNYLKAVFNRGFSYDKIGEYEKACEDYSRAILIDNKCSFAYFNRGISYDKLNQYEKAINDFSEAIKLDSANSDFYLNRGNSLQKLELHQQAIEDYTRCIDFQTNKLPSVLLSRAMSYEKCGDPQRAKLDYQKSLNLGTSQEYVCCSRLANIHSTENNYQVALSLYNRGLAANPSSIYCLAKRGQLFMKLNKYELAYEDFTKGIQLNDGIVQLYANRAKILIYQQKYILAAQDLLQVLILKPNDVNIIKLYIKTMMQLEDYEEALKYIESEISLEGVQVQSLYNRQYCFSKLQLYKEAQADILLLLESDPKNIQLQNNLAISLFNQHQYQQALDVLASIIDQYQDQKDISDALQLRDQCLTQLKIQQNNKLNIRKRKTEQFKSSKKRNEANA